MVSLNTSYKACAIAKSCGKSRYWQEPWSPNHKVQWNMMSSNTNQVKDLRSKGDIGVHTQPVPYKIAVPKQTSLPKAKPE